MRILKIISCSHPDDFGYNDYGVLMSTSGAVLWEGKMSTCPNPYKPSSLEPWEKHYGWIEAGVYTAQVTRHKKYGKCLYIGDAASRNPNPNHGGRYDMTEVFIHQGAFRCRNVNWRGSAGCPTIPRESWQAFLSCLHNGEKVRVQIVDGAPELKARFYKGGKRGTKFMGFLIRLRTGEKHEHCELDFGKLGSFSSSGYDKGVRWKQIDYRKHSSRWDTVKLDFTPFEIYEMSLHCTGHVGEKYDFRAILFWHFLPFRRQNKNRWYCSEMLAHIIGYKPEQINPGKLFKALI